MNSYSNFYVPKGIKTIMRRKKKGCITMLKIIVERKTVESYKNLMKSVNKDLELGLTEKDFEEKIPEVNKKGYRVINNDDQIEITIKDGYFEKIFELYEEYIPTIFTAAKSLIQLLTKFGARVDKIMKVFDEDVEENKDQEAK